MAEVPPQIPGWMEEIFDYLEEKPYRYSPLIDGHFGLRGSEENPGDGFGFSLGFLFSAVVSPEQMELNLTKYRIVKNTAESEALDLIGTITEGFLFLSTSLTTLSPSSFDGRTCVIRTE